MMIIFRNLTCHSLYLMITPAVVIVIVITITITKNYSNFAMLYTITMIIVMIILDLDCFLIYYTLLNKKMSLGYSWCLLNSI